MTTPDRPAGTTGGPMDPDGEVVPAGVRPATSGSGPASVAGR